MSNPKRRAEAPAGGGRARGSPRCARCRMHVPLCLCGELVAAPTETEVLLVTHVTELDRPTNTGRLLDLALEGAKVLPSGGPAGLRPAIAPRADRRLYLLYPDPEAVVLDAAWAHADPRPLTIVVPDGTWSQTRRMAARWFPHLPRLSLPDGPASRFVLREGGSAERICTLEAVARALGVIEGHAVEARLLDLLAMMVDRTRFTRGVLPAEQVFGGLDSRAHASGMSRNS